MRPRAVAVAMPEGRAGEARFDVRQPNLIRPAVGAQGNAMAAVVVGAIVGREES